MPLAQHRWLRCPHKKGFPREAFFVLGCTRSHTPCYQNQELPALDSTGFTHKNHLKTNGYVRLQLTFLNVL